MSEHIRIAAVDDHPLFLEGLQRALRAVPELELICQGHSAADARRISREVKPDILLLDIGIPGDGIAALRAIALDNPAAKIVMLTGSDDDDHVADALAAGAKGYLLKGAGLAELVEAVRSVNAGQPYVMQAVASRMLVQKLGVKTLSVSRQLDQLNYRERQVLDYAAQGMTNRDIAVKLKLKVRTVKNYMSRILQKMQARNRFAAIAAYGGLKSETKVTCRQIC